MFFKDLSWKSCSGETNAGKLALMLSTTSVVFFCLYVDIEFMNIKKAKSSRNRLKKSWEVPT